LLLPRSSAHHFRRLVGCRTAGVRRALLPCAAGFLQDRVIYLCEEVFNGPDRIWSVPIALSGPLRGSNSALGQRPHPTASRGGVSRSQHSVSMRPPRWRAVFDLWTPQSESWRCARGLLPTPPGARVAGRWSPTISPPTFHLVSILPCERSRNCVVARVAGEHSNCSKPPSTWDSRAAVLGHRTAFPLQPMDQGSPQFAEFCLRVERTRPHTPCFPTSRDPG